MQQKRRRTSEEEEAKAVHLVKMGEVANLIVSPVPPWLPDVLSHFSFDVRSQHSIDGIWPTRKDLWTLLVRGNALAIELQDILRHFAVAGFLVTNSKLDSERFLDDLAGQLVRFTALTAEAARSPLLVGKNGKPLAGPGKPLLPGVMPAKYVCAAIISEVISFFVEQSNPLPSKRKAYAAAEQFWKAWPTKEGGTTDDPTKAWARYFDAASSSELEALRKQVRLHLSVRARDGI
jgi:hypothetical protein